MFLSGFPLLVAGRVGYENINGPSSGRVCSCVRGRSSGMVKSNVLFLERSLSSPFVGQRCCQRISGKQCSLPARDISCSSTRISRKGIELESQKKFLPNDLSRGFGLNKAYKRPYTRKSYVLDAADDEYDGVIIDSERLPHDPSIFASALQTSLFHWRLKGKKGVWLKLPLELSDLVPIAVKEGFKYHHAEEDYVMLAYWISEGPSMLPGNASHQVGVGGFVINNKNEVLVVQEKHCAPAFSGFWKLPTGFILEAEEIFEGAVREVKEETGIDTEFEEVVAFRHAHRVAFEKSDLFFICMLRPLTTTIQIDDLEIQAAKWMPLVDFVEQPTVRGDQLFRKIIDICIKRLSKRYCGLSAHHLSSEFDGTSSCLYYNVLDIPDCSS